MNTQSSNLVLPIHLAANNFLEVLLDNFKLERFGDGSLLTVNFNKNSLAVWGFLGKEEVKKGINDYQVKYPKLQRILDDFLVYQKYEKDVFELKDFLFVKENRFPFRYASGGTLPIVRYGSKEYFCLFYREIDPIGWNIANGGCDDRNELLNPLDTIERELNEELIAFDKEKEIHYVFKYDNGKSLNLPEFVATRRLLRKIIGKDIEAFQKIEIPLTWIDGPDRLFIKMDEDDKVWQVEKCFLNITAKDFGIEIDKIAQINLDENVRLIDGEVAEFEPINAIVGLFDIEKFDKTSLDNEDTEYFPDIFFYNGERYESSEFNSKFRLAWEQMKGRLNRWNAQMCIDEFEKPTTVRFALCPVTWRIIKRYTLLPSPDIKVPLHQSVQAFLSCASEDIKVAAQVHNYLENQMKISTFFYPYKRHPSFLTAINDALDSAHDMIVVGSNLENITKPWVEYEWMNFFKDIKSKRKENALLIPFISESVGPMDLPRPLREYDPIRFKENDIKDKLIELDSTLRWKN